MGLLYPGTTVTSYNANPPPDDGTTVATNLVTWAGIKSKLGDPLNTFATTVDTNLTAAFAKTLDGGSIVATAINYPAGVADQGRLIRATAAGVNITTPDATVVHAPFMFGVLNNSSGSITVVGANPGVQQNVDGQPSVAIPAGAGAVFQTDGSNWYSYGQNTATTQVTPQGRLTLVSGSPVMSADVTATTLIYYTPYVGNLIPIPNGSIFRTQTFSELTLTINNTNYIANTIYDVFIFLDPADNATVRIGTGPAWANSAAGSGSRGSGAGTTEIARLNGLWTNNNAISLRNNATTFSVALKAATYVGSIFIDGTNGQISCHFSIGQSRKFGVWNAYNRNKIVLQVQDGTASWAYNSATVRQSNAAAGNTALLFTGLAEEVCEAVFVQSADMSVNGTTCTAFNGIGLNSTTVISGMQGRASNSPTVQTSVSGDIVAEFNAAPALGLNNINCLEKTNAGGAVTFNGAASFLMKCTYMG